MNTLEETALLKFNSNTLEEVRKALNLDHEGIEQMIKNFEEWISKQNHFNKVDFDRHYLETSILQGKGSLEKAKNTLDKLCTLKTLLPQFFCKPDVKNDLIDTSGFMIHAIMPKLTEDNYRAYVAKIVSTGFDSTMMQDFDRFAILLCEYIKFFDYSQGFVCVIDCRNINILNFITKINILNLRDSMSVILEGYGMRIKGIHLISTSKTIDTFISLIKQVISAKIVDRIHVHSTIESLHEFVPKKILPDEFGGNEQKLKDMHENWVKVLSSSENLVLLKDICKAGTNEKHRLAANYNDQILGMPGSFRTLTVD